MIIRGGILDPGHGATDLGACHNGVIERDVAFDVAERAQLVLRERGWASHITHDIDVDPTHVYRANVAVRLAAVGTILIHVNSGAEGEHGSLGFYKPGDVLGRFAATAAVKRLARPGVYREGEALKPMRSQVHVLRDLPWMDRVRACLSPHVRPAAFIELEYCSHAESACWLLSNLDLAAQAVADGMEAFAVKGA